MSVGHGPDPGFFAVSRIDPVVGCYYFPPGPWLLPSQRDYPRWPLASYTAW